MYRAGAPDFGTLAAAARAGNPDAIVAFNPGPSSRVYSLTPHEDFLGGEVREPMTSYPDFRRVEGGLFDTAQVHLVAPYGSSPEQVFAWTRRANLEAAAMTWSVPLRRSGLIAEEQMRSLGVLSRLLEQPAYVGPGPEPRRP
jgi:hypothetical protein